MDRDLLVLGTNAAACRPQIETTNVGFIHPHTTTSYSAGWTKSTYLLTEQMLAGKCQTGLLLLSYFSDGRDLVSPQTFQAYVGEIEIKELAIDTNTWRSKEASEGLSWREVAIDCIRPRV